MSEGLAFKSFVSETELNEKRQKRQEEWEKVRTADQPEGMYTVHIICLTPMNWASASKTILWKLNYILKHYDFKFVTRHMKKSAGNLLYWRSRHICILQVIRRRSYVIIGFVAPAIGPNKSKKLTRLVSPTHNIRGKVRMKNSIHGFTDNVTSGMSLRRWISQPW